MCKCIRFPVALRVVMGLLLFSVFGFENIVLAERQVVAVGRIENRAKGSPDPRSFRDMLTTALVKTGKLKVIERDRIMEVWEEQEMALRGVAREGYTGDHLMMRGVDYILTGAITGFGFNKASAIPQGLVESRSAVMDVDLRLLKVRTGRVGFAETVRIKTGGDIRINMDNRYGNGGRRSDGDLLGEVLRKAADKATNLIVVSIYPVKIVGINRDGIVRLNYGDAILSPGDRLDVFQLGEEMIDPDTGESLGQEEELVGKIQVVSVTYALSEAKVLDVIGELSEGMVARKDSKRPWERGSLKLVKPHKEELF